MFGFSGFYNVTFTAKDRLEAYRKKAEEYRARFNGDCHYCRQVRNGDYRNEDGSKRELCYYCEEASAATWRNQARIYSPFKRRSAGNWAPDKRGVYYADSFPDSWRDCGDAHEVARRHHSRSIDHTGWYADSFQVALIRGRVLQLPADKNGTPRYVPATYCTDWDGVTLYLGDICDDELDAARRADRLAEIEAEDSREAHAKDAAEQEIEDLREQVRQTRQKALALLREMRPVRKTGIQAPAICEALRASIASHLEDIREARERIEALQENYWLAVES